MVEMQYCNNIFF